MAQKKFIIDGGFQTNADSVITGNLTMTGHVVPSVDSDGVTGYDLGTPTAKWRDLYLSRGSLYIDGQKVLESNSGTIVVQADPDQSLTTKVSGSGVLTLQSATTINVAGTLQMGIGKNITSADGVAVQFGDKIDMNGNEIVEVGAPTAATSAASKSYVDTTVATEISTALAGFNQNAIQENDSNVTINDAGTGEVIFTVDGTTRMEVSSTGVAVSNLTIGGVTAATTAYVDTAEADAIATASADATAKANAAQSAAEATASADATAKVAAETTARTAADAALDTAKVDKNSAQALSTGVALSVSGNILSLAKGNGTADSVDLSIYLDDTNAARIVSGTMDAAGIATFTRDDATSFTVDMSVLLDDTNLSRITSATWNTADGVLTLTRNDNSTVTVDLDGRYATSAQLSDEAGLRTSGDAATLTSANAYTDGEISTLDSALKAYADQAEADAVTTANAYTDSSIAAIPEVDLSAVGQNIIPSTDITYDLGSSTNRWRDLFLSGNTIHLGDKKISAGTDGTVEVKDSTGKPVPLKAKSVELDDEAGDTQFTTKMKKVGGKVKFVKVDRNTGAESADVESVDLGANSTDDLTEGTANLFYTDARVSQHIINSELSDTGNITTAINASKGAAVEEANAFTTLQLASTSSSISNTLTDYVQVSSSQALTPSGAALYKVGNNLVLAKGNGTSDSVDLTPYLDDTNLARIISGTMNSSGIATFQRDDNSTFTVDMSVLLDDTNLSRITSATWNTGNGVLTLTRNDNSTVTVDLDGRYQAAGSYVTTSSAQALRATDALQVSNDTITLFKGDGTSESVSISDANTWRPVVDNLTSTAADVSLSANQGRVLKGLIDGKQPAGTYNTRIGISIDQSLQNANVVSTLTTTDGVITGFTTRTLTPANIGAQSTLVSGSNIKTINGQSLLGSGNITIESSGGGSGDLTSVSTDIIPAFDAVYDLGSATNRWYNLSVANMIQLGTGLMTWDAGTQSFVFNSSIVTDKVTANEVLATSAYIGDVGFAGTTITPVSETAQYVDDKGTLTVDGNLIVTENLSAAATSIMPRKGLNIGDIINIEAYDPPPEPVEISTELYTDSGFQSIYITSYNNTWNMYYDSQANCHKAVYEMFPDWDGQESYFNTLSPPVVIKVEVFNENNSTTMTEFVQFDTFVVYSNRIDLQNAQHLSGDYIPNSMPYYSWYNTAYTYSSYQLRSISVDGPAGTMIEFDEYSLEYSDIKNLYLNGSSTVLADLKMQSSDMMVGLTQGTTVPGWYNVGMWPTTGDGGQMYKIWQTAAPGTLFTVYLEGYGNAGIWKLEGTGYISGNTVHRDFSFVSGTNHIANYGFGPTVLFEGLYWNTVNYVIFNQVATPVLDAIGGTWSRITNGGGNAVFVEKSLNEVQSILAVGDTITVDERFVSFKVGTAEFKYDDVTGAFESPVKGVFVKDDTQESIHSDTPNAAPPGLWSTGLGYNTIPNGEGSVAIGTNAQSIGNYSIAIGKNQYANGTNSIAIGANQNVTGFGSIAIGNQAGPRNGQYCTYVGYGGYNQGNMYHNTVIGCMGTSSGGWMWGEGQHVNSIGASNIYLNNAGDYATVIGGSSGSTNTDTPGCAVNYNPSTYSTRYEFNSYNYMYNSSTSAFYAPFGNGNGNFVHQITTSEKNDGHYNPYIGFQTYATAFVKGLTVHIQKRNSHEWQLFELDSAVINNNNGSPFITGTATFTNTINNSTTLPTFTVTLHVSSSRYVQIKVQSSSADSQYYTVRVTGDMVVQRPY